LLAAIVVATAIGLTLRRRDGRFRPTRAIRTAATPPAVTPPPSTQPPTAPAPPIPAPLTPEPTPEHDPSHVAGLVSAAPDPDSAAAAPRTTGPPPGSLAGELTALGQPGGERATLLQFSTAFCGPCRTTRAVLADVARLVPGVAHVEVDAEAHLDLVRRLGIRRTPTVLVLDRDAREISRASGAPPSRAAVIAALGPAATPGQDLR
jgi:thiol-disulfide isomerase/thioredoxin